MTWQLSRNLEPGEYDVVLKQLGLNYASAARFLGISARTSSRYAKGKAKPSAAEVLLLRTFIAKKIKPVVPPWSYDRNKHW